jgi:hypothetical protein
MITMMFSIVIAIFTVNLSPYVAKARRIRDPFAYFLTDLFLVLVVCWWFWVEFRISLSRELFFFA